jgi:probable dihydroxyacetone kinase regulator
MPDSNITKNALASALKGLMKRKPFSKISVRDICEECGMNRKSFYYHFKDKYDLVNWIFYVDFVSEITVGSYDNGWELLVALCDLFYNDREFYHDALMIEGQNSFRDYFYETLQPLVKFFIQDIFNDSQEQEFFTVFVVEGFLATMVRWLSDDQDTTPRRFLSQIRDVILALAASLKDDMEQTDE